MLGSILLAAIAAATPAASSSTVPFTLFDNRILVAVSVDGTGPFTMIVDTGAPGFTVTPSVARRLGLTARVAGYSTGAGSGSTARGVTRVPSVTLGSLHFDDVPTEVLDLSPIRKAIGFPQLDGIVGYSMLRKFRVRVDMDAERLTLSSAPLPVPKNAATVPFTLDDTLIHVAGAVDGVDGTFILDTGDRSSLTLFRHFAEANDFYRDAPVRNAITGIGIGGPVYSDVLRTTFSLFDSTIPSVVTRASRDRGGAFALGSEAGSVGNGLLRRFNIVYDYPDAELFAWPSHYFPLADRYAPLAFSHGVLSVQQNAADPTMAGAAPLPRHALFGAAVVTANDGVRATIVVAGGAAAQAGLRTGDVIRAVDGEPTATATEFLTTVHNLHAGQHVSVDVVRDGTPLRLYVVLGTAPDERDSGVVTTYGQVMADASARRTLLALPRGLSSPAPAVLLIGGIGCTRRAATYMNLTHDLARAGFATMRVEKSGVGDSEGPPCRNVDFDGEERGYEAALDSLRHYPRVDPSRIYLLGHSIGTIIAPRLAAPNRVAGVIVVEAVGRDWPEYEIRNLRRDLELDGESPASTDRALLEKAQCFERLFFENEPEAKLERSMPSCRIHNGIYPVGAPYVRQLAHLNVIEPWMHLTVPVLAVYGTSDFETELADHQRIVDVMNAAHPGSATLVVIPSMSHGLGHAATPKTAETDDNDRAIERYDAEVSAAIVAWLRSIHRA